MDKYLEYVQEMKIRNWRIGWLTNPPKIRLSNLVCLQDNFFSFTRSYNTVCQLLTLGSHKKLKFALSVSLHSWTICHEVVPLDHDLAVFFVYVNLPDSNSDYKRLTWCDNLLKVLPLSRPLWQIGFAELT